MRINIFWLNLNFFSSKIRYKTKVENIIIKNKLQDNVEILGVKTGREKEYFFRQADIFCFPSYYECENYPIVIIEAMKYSLAIISTNWRAIPDIIEDGKTGLLIPIKEHNILKEKIELLTQVDRPKYLSGFNKL